MTQNVIRGKKSNKLLMLLNILPFLKVFPNILEVRYEGNLFTLLVKPTSHDSFVEEEGTRRHSEVSFPMNSVATVSILTELKRKSTEFVKSNAIIPVGFVIFFFVPEELTLNSLTFLKMLNST